MPTRGSILPALGGSKEGLALVRALGAPNGLGDSVRLPQHPDQYRPERPVLLAERRSFSMESSVDEAHPLPSSISVVRIFTSLVTRRAGSGSRAVNRIVPLPLVRPASSSPHSAIIRSVYG